jgi:hypothetical protein
MSTTPSGYAEPRERQRIGYHRPMPRLTALLLLLPSMASAQEVWRGDFETNDTLQWDGELNGMVGGEDRVVIVRDPVFEGMYAARIELTNDAVWPNGLKRVELHHAPAAGRTLEGSELWFAWSFFLPETLPRDPDQQIGYWETDVSYQQLMAFTLIGSDLRFSTNRPDWQEHWVGTGVVTPLRWHRIAMHIVWSTDPATGTVDVWFDGEQVVLAAHAATLVDGNPAFTQLGLLRGAVEFTDRPVIVVDDAVEGDSLESVRPDAVPMRPDAGASEDAAMAIDAPLPDAGGADAGPGPASTGCGCRAGRGSLPAGLGLFVVLAALAARRFLGASTKPSPTTTTTTSTPTSTSDGAGS